MLPVKKANLLIHGTGIFMFLCLPLLFTMGNEPENPGSVFISPTYWLFCGTYIFLFYFNTYFLIPRLYLAKKFVYYFGVLTVLFALIYFIKPYDQFVRHKERPHPGSMRNFGPPPPPSQGERGPGAPGGMEERRSMRVDIVSIFLYFMVIALGMAIQVTEQWRQSKMQVKKAEADKANAELSFLKAQINPHFLFNTLNNIYSLAVTKNEKTADSIMKLSNIMRYITDDVTENFVMLQSEIDCIRDYIELQRLRLSSKTTVEFTVSGDTAHKKIAPLVLMTFVENVFKYGISNHEDAAINIQLIAGERNISFLCRNKIFKTANPERTGVGIANTRKRLEQLYPNQHLLNIVSENGYYIVELTIIL
jgi:two-component system LytT family sensor kinase